VKRLQKFAVKQWNSLRCEGSLDGYLCVAESRVVICITT
jgi:hypothetical protein